MAPRSALPTERITATIASRDRRKNPLYLSASFEAAVVAGTVTASGMLSRAHLITPFESQIRFRFGQHKHDHGNVKDGISKSRRLSGVSSLTIFCALKTTVRVINGGFPCSWWPWHFNSLHAFRFE